MSDAVQRLSGGQVVMIAGVYGAPAYLLAAVAAEGAVRVVPGAVTFYVVYVVLVVAWTWVLTGIVLKHPRRERGRRG